MGEHSPCSISDAGSGGACKTFKAVLDGGGSSTTILKVELTMTTMMTTTMTHTKPQYTQNHDRGASHNNACMAQEGDILLCVLEKVKRRSGNVLWSSLL